jgi:hypothetical protein
MNFVKVEIGARIAVRLVDELEFGCQRRTGGLLQSQARIGQLRASLSGIEVISQFHSATKQG